MKHALLGLVALTISAGAVLAQDKPSSEQRTIERRAVEAAIWGMPVVNYDLMLQEMLAKTAGKVNQVDLLGPAARLAEPDADAQPRHALLHDVLRHEGAARS